MACLLFRSALGLTVRMPSGRPAFWCILRVYFGRILPLFATGSLLAGCAAGAPLPSGADAFYAQRQSADGIPVIASPRVSAKALTAAQAMARGMLAHRSDLARWLAANGYTIAVMAKDEALLDLPEFRHWTKPAKDDPRLTRCELKHYDERIGAKTDRQYWDYRARAIGGRHMVAAEEDLLDLTPNRYFGETIFVHEFAHQILDALRGTDPVLYARVQAAYANARAKGLWRDEYTITTIDEYWAEGSQFWWNSNRLQVFDRRRILESEDLAAYDPALNAVLAEVYGDRHRLPGDPYYKHFARVPPGPPPANTAEVC